MDWPYFLKNRSKLNWFSLGILGFVGIYDIFSGIETSDVRSVLKGAAAVLLGVYFSTSPTHEQQILRKTDALSSQRLKTARLLIIVACATLFFSSFLV